MDFIIVPTIRFKLLYYLVILSHARRRIIYFAVTTVPTAAWVARQLSEAFPWSEADKKIGVGPDLFCRTRPNISFATMTQFSMALFGEDCTALAFGIDQLHQSRLGRTDIQSGLTGQLGANVSITFSSSAKRISVE